MTDAELDELEAKAKAATPGPWHIKRGYCLYDERDMHVVSAWENYCNSLRLTIDSDEAMANAMFLQAANPAEILDLIAELRQARAERDWLAHNFVRKNCPSVRQWEKCNIDSDEYPEACVTCWLKAAKEATCQKN